MTRKQQNAITELNARGIDVRHDMEGFYILTTAEAAFEDEGHASAGFDGRTHFDDIEDAIVAALSDPEVAG